MKKTFYIALVMAMAFVLASPVYAVGENDLTVESGFQFTVGSNTFTGVGNVDSIVVDTASFTVEISSGSLIEIYSADKWTYSYTDDPDVNFYCEIDRSRLALGGTGDLTVEFTPVETACVYIGGGGGGGTVPYVAPVETPAAEPVETPAAEPAETPAEEPAEEPAETPTTTTEDTISSTPAEPAVNEQGQVTLGQMADDASAVASGDVAQVIAKMGMARDTALEAQYSSEIVSKVVTGVTGVTAQVRNVVNNFVTYGTKSTKVLGAGERAGVVNSYKEAFGKLPTTTEEWNDVVKIANGRWPNERSEAKEDKASISFRSIYLRDADMDDPHDNAAVTVMAYGLRPANRNLDSERVAINTFRYVFGYSPTTASNWDAVRAIAYSGSTR